MEILFWIIFGTMAGWIASVLYENKDKSGVLKDILLGVLGAVSGVLFINALGYSGTSVYNAFSVLSASTFAFLLIGIGRIRTQNEEGVWQS